MTGRSLYGYLRDLAELYPDRVSVVDHDGSEVTSRDLLDKVEQCSHYLETIGSSAKYVILVSCGSASYYAWCIASLSLGKVFVPVDKGWPGSRIEEVVQQVRQADPHVLVIQSDELLPNFKAEPKLFAPPLESPAWLIFTSGSTGKPKGVALSYGFVLEQETDISPEDIKSLKGEGLGGDARIKDALLQYTSIAVASQLNYCVAAARGYTIVCATKNDLIDSRRARAIFSRFRIRRILMTPSLCHQLLDFPEWFSTFSEIYLFGEAVGEDILSRLPDLLPAGVLLMDLYGQTEVAIWLAERNLMKDGPWRARSGSGLSIENGEIAVADQGDHKIFRGYLGSEPRELGRAFLTGDLAHGSPQGFHLKGRADGMLKVRGFRVQREELEGILSRLTVSRAAVAIRGAMLLAFVERGEDQEDPEEFDRRVRAEMNFELPASHVPDRFFQVKKIPLTDSLKIDRMKVQDLIEEERDFERSDEALYLFQRLFPFQTEFTDTSSFQDLGGHSLLLLKAMSILRSRGLEGRLSPSDLLRLDCLGEIREKLALPPVIQDTSEPVLPIARGFSYFPPLRESIARPRSLIRHIRNMRRLTGITRVDVAVDRAVSDAEVHVALTELVRIHPVLESQARRVGRAMVPGPGSKQRPITLRTPSDLWLWGLLNGEPLFRAQRLGEETIRLSLHHGMSDNESCEILGRDFLALINGSSLPQRPYENLEGVRDVMEGLPARCPYSVPGGMEATRGTRWIRTFAFDFRNEEKFVLPALILAFARSWEGPVQVPVFMDARTAPHLLNVDATQLISFLSISRLAEAHPEMSLVDVRKSLDDLSSKYYRVTSFRGGLSDIVFRGAQPGIADLGSESEQGEINLNFLEQSGAQEQPDRLMEGKATAEELRDPNIASIYAEYYADRGQLFVNACGPTKVWVQSLARSIRALASTSV